MLTPNHSPIVYSNQLSLIPIHTMSKNILTLLTHCIHQNNQSLYTWFNIQHKPYLAVLVGRCGCFTWSSRFVQHLHQHTHRDQNKLELITTCCLHSNANKEQKNTNIVYTLLTSQTINHCILDSTSIDDVGYNTTQTLTCLLFVAVLVARSYLFMQHLQQANQWAHQTMFTCCLPSFQCKQWTKQRNVIYIVFTSK